MTHEVFLLLPFQFSPLPHYRERNQAAGGYFIAGQGQTITPVVHSLPFNFQPQSSASDSHKDFCFQDSEAYIHKYLKDLMVLF